jgi:hypothetical protein
VRRTVPHDPTDPAEIAAIQTPPGQPDGELYDPDDVDLDDESSDEVIPE